MAKRASKKPVYGELGTVSHGTMREEDLIPEFVSLLRDLAKRAGRKDHLALAEEIEQRMDDTEQDYFGSEAAGWDLNESLFPALEEYAPSYAYFGANEGDGSDYGFWLSSEVVNDVKDNGGLVVDDLSAVPKGYTGEVLHVNDHGNLELYSARRGKLTSIWGVTGKARKKRGPERKKRPGGRRPASQYRPKRGSRGPHPVKEAVGWAIVDGDLVLERHLDKRTAHSRAKAMRRFAAGDESAMPWVDGGKRRRGGKVRTAGGLAAAVLKLVR